jgi:hypothetical protein
MTISITRRLSIVALLLPAAVLAACSFEKNTVQTIDGPVPTGAWVKFFNFGIGAPGVNFYANTRKVTAVSSGTGVEATTGVTYGSAGAGGLYTAIDAGQYALMGKIAAATDKDLAISNVSATLEEGKSYSFYQSGPYSTATKSVDAFLIEDNFPPEVDYSVASVRFVNAIANATNPLILYATKTNQPDSGLVVQLGPAVAYKSGGAFTGLGAGVYNLAARYPDSTANKISRTGVTLVLGRTYTISARGDITVAAPPANNPTGTNGPFLDNTANR